MTDLDLKELKSARANGERPEAPLADLHEADLRGANLYGADLRRTILDGGEQEDRK